MPRKTPPKHAQWKYKGRSVGYSVDGTYYIARTLAGRRVRISTGCVTLTAANVEYDKFEVNPAAYVSPLGRRAFAGRKPRGSSSDPVRAAQLRDNHFARRYAITPADYARMLAEQDGGCAICGALPAGVKGGVYDVDHDHRTGKIRGLLCGPCNRGLGAFGDDVPTLRRAAEYLEARVTQS
jgi:hypothetical protein